jgi:uncharacterized membrane protein (UPF0182 family)
MGIEDLIFSRDTGFYPFILTLCEVARNLLLILTIIVAITSAIAIFIRRGDKGIELMESNQTNDTFENYLNYHVDMDFDRASNQL